MMFALPAFLGGWRLYAALAIAAAVVAAGVWIALLRADNRALEAQHAQLVAELGRAAKAAEDNARALERAQAEHLADMLLFQQHAEARTAAALRESTILKEINDAPASDDGPLAPVLWRTLNSLRQDGHGD